MTNPYEPPEEDDKETEPSVSNWLREVLLNPTGATGCVTASVGCVIVLCVIALAAVMLGALAWHAASR